MKTKIKINNRWDEMTPEIQLEMTRLINSTAASGRFPVTIRHDGSKTCLKIELAPDILAAYIEMNGRTYYIDDCNGEFVMDSWTPGEEATR